MANYVKFKQGFEKDFNTTKQPLTNGMIYFVIDANNHGSIYFDTVLDGTSSNKNGAVRRVKFAGLPIEVTGSVTGSGKITEDGSKIVINTSTSHSHGLMHQDFTVTLPNDSTVTAWTQLGSSNGGGFWLKSIRSNANAPAWFLDNYSAGIAFGGADTKGVISAAYNSPQIRFAGGNGTEPKWNITVTGTTGKTYDLNKLGANASSADKLSHNVTFKVKPVANQTSGETGVTTNLSGTEVNLVLCEKISGFQNIQSTRFQGNADSATYAGYAQSLYLNPTSRQANLNYTMSNSNYNKKVTYSLASSITTTGKPSIGDSGVLTFGWDTTTGWGAQLAININKNAHLAIRGASDSSGSSDWGSWATVLDSSNYTSYVNNYYWANVKVSTSSNTDTKPTFGQVTTNGWIYSSNINTGWMNTQGGGGIYMADTTWVRVYGGKKFRVDNTSSDAIYTTGTVRGALGFTTDGTMILYPSSNEVNFGGTNTSTHIYFGYRAKDSRAIPTAYVFGSSSAGTAMIKAASATFGNMCISSSNWLGWYATKGDTTSTRYGYIQNDLAANGVMKFVREQGGYFTFNGHILPTANNSYNLGDSTHTWAGIHTQNLVLYGQTGNRLVWTNGNKALQAGYHYADTTKVAINYTSAPSYNFYVNGTSRFAGTVDVNGLTTHHNHITLDTGYTIYSSRNSSSWNNSHANALIRITGSDTNGAWFPLLSQTTTNGYWTAGYYPSMQDDYIIGYYPKTNVTNNNNSLAFRLRLKTTLSGDYMPVLAKYGNAIGGSFKPVYVNNHGEVVACTYTVQSTVNAGTANRMTYYSGANALSAASEIYTNGKYLAIGEDNSSYKLYISGASYLKGNITHNGTVFFANGTTYSITNSADARLRYLGVGTANYNSSYAINIGGAMNVSGNAIHTGHVYPTASATYDLGTSGSHWRNLYIQNITLSGQTKNRMMWTTSSNGVTASDHYVDSTHVAIGSTSQPSTSFYVKGSTYLNDKTTINNNLTITNGCVTLAGNRYNGKSSYGLDANNSDIIGVNAILTADLADTFGEGYNFYRTESTYDAMAANSGVFYFGSNVAHGAALAGSATLDAGKGLFRTCLSIGVSSLQGSYALYTNGTSYFTNTMNFANNVGIYGVMASNDCWGIVGTGTSDAGRLKIYVGDNATSDWLDFEFRDCDTNKTIYTPLSMTGNNIKVTSNINVTTNNKYNLGASGMRWAKVYVGGADSYGSTTKPIYWNAGVPTACSYELKSTVNNGTASRMAYYSGTNAISSATSIYASDTTLGINGTPGSYTFYVKGGTYLQGTTKVYKAIQILGNEATDNSTHLRFLASDSTERATISFNGNTDASTAHLRIYARYGYINLYSSSGVIRLYDKVAFRSNDSWLRINDQNGFTAGVYFGSSLTRTDGQFQVGSDGSHFYANNSGNTYVRNSLHIGNTGISRDTYKFYTQGNSYLNGRVGINGYNANYYLFVTGDSYFNGNIVIPNNKALIQHQANTSNATTAIKWLKNATSQNTYDPQVGHHNTGGTSSLGAAYIVPYATASEPWGGSVGLYITKNLLKLDGKRIPTAQDATGTVGNGKNLIYSNSGVLTVSTSTVGSSTVPVYLNNGTLTTISSYSGNAATASKLKTARTITINNLVRGSVSFDGSTNVSISTQFYHCTIEGGNQNNYPWRRIAYIQNINSTYGDYIGLFRIRHKYVGGGEGLVKVALRTNSSGQACQIQTQWLYRYNIPTDSIAIAYYGTTGNNVYADVFYKSPSAWPRCIVENIGTPMHFNLLNSKEASDTTSSDRLTSTECYTSVAEAATKVRGQAYTDIQYGQNTPQDKLTARTIKIGNKALSFDGTQNLTYTLAAIGAVNKAGDTMTGALTCNGRVISADISSSWLDGLKSVAAYKVSAASDSNGYHPWIQQTNNSSGYCFSFGMYGNTFRMIGCPTSQTANGYTAGLVFDVATGYLTGCTRVYGAVWNDYAEYRENKQKNEPGRVVIETGQGDLVLSTSRLQPGANVISDTYGFAIGETEKAKSPIAVSGRVLAYPHEDKKVYRPGDAVCTGPGGTISKMTREEIIIYPERIVGTVSEIPNYEFWGEENIKVNGRIWIKVR